MSFYVELKAKGHKLIKRDVLSFNGASGAVRDFIEQHDLTAGCGSDGVAFTGGKIFKDGKHVGRVSYNGRVWDLNDKEIVS